MRTHVYQFAKTKISLESLPSVFLTGLALISYAMPGIEMGKNALGDRPKTRRLDCTNSVHSCPLLHCKCIVLLI
ncbi:MAG: hypothetical protein ICV78_09810 [Tolypothrix sp. Co-bin9]|nr:hypothetical protein [Tolypothrix sp. Co-bin9]